VAGAASTRGGTPAKRSLSRGADPGLRDDQEPVEAFGVDGADEALGNVRFRLSYGCLDGGDAFARKDGVEVRGELVAAVANQEPESCR
jgi:hypothetical protein